MGFVNDTVQISFDKKLLLRSMFDVKTLKVKVSLKGVDINENQYINLLVYTNNEQNPTPTLYANEI